MLMYIFSTPDLLADIREELETIACDGNIISAQGIRDCATLMSTWNEVMRVASRGASARMVMEDTDLLGKWQLKKGGVVLIPTAVMHADEKTWGDTAFDARRWMQGKTKRLPAACYRPFGGGSTICPGRHFGAMEVLLVTAFVVLGYDILPVHGRLEVPKQKQRSLVDAVFGPEKDVKVRLVMRDGIEKTGWSFKA